MLKTVLLYIVVFTFVGATSYFLHNWALNDTQMGFHALLRKAYLFHGLFSLSVLIAFRLTAGFDSIFPQLGFIYIGSVVLKITVFTAMFYPQLMGDQAISRFYRASLLVPMAIFLILEVLFVIKILQRKES
ncbi:DUF6168 family protein [Pseudozobellia thermophila]|uniref:DUF6168 family protein n=1 Tax=Pseudozobellia thermophila TaxID=192903 RepID=UPI00147AAF22|nr:DUF6168 family protein [Pseudozobellia thermophila]